MIEYMQECRALTLEQMQRLIQAQVGHAPDLYQLILDHPLRDGKALRPALCIATCRALGGKLESVAPTAAIIELYHNAFLIHDDIEDGSEKRRDRPTLHREQGTAVAINVGDAMLALALQPLLDNTRLVGLGPALRVLQLIARMARVSAEGQARELAWISGVHWQLHDHDYLRMVYEKTAWYTFITPMVAGALLAGCREGDTRALWQLATLMGIAFQIQDDILNLDGDENTYGKELLGDLWEGKHTLILIHALRKATPIERAHALDVLRKPRPVDPATSAALTNGSWENLIRELRASGELSPAAAERLRWHISATDVPHKTQDDVHFLKQLVLRTDSIQYARSVAVRHAHRAHRLVVSAMNWSRPSPHYDFIAQLVDYILERDR